VSENKRYKPLRLLFMACYSCVKEIYLNNVIDQFPLSNNNFSQTLGISNSSEVHLVLYKRRWSFFLSLWIRQTKDLQPAILCIQRRKSLCWRRCIVRGACLHIWMTFLHEFMLCHFANVRSAQEKRDGPQCTGFVSGHWKYHALLLVDIFLCFICCFWFSGAHCRICYLYWS
jgi:hypothetical protein